VVNLAGWCLFLVLGQRKTPACGRGSIAIVPVWFNLAVSRRLLAVFVLVPDEPQAEYAYYQATEWEYHEGKKLWCGHFRLLRTALASKCSTVLVTKQTTAMADVPIPGELESEFSSATVGAMPPTAKRAIAIPFR